MLQSLSSAFFDEEGDTVRLSDSHAGLGSHKANWQIQAKSNFHKTIYIFARVPKSLAYEVGAGKSSNKM
jgi:hypothetical protein